MIERPVHRAPAFPVPAGPATETPVSGLSAIVMAAGVGKRMKSKLAKVLHTVAGRPMILYVVELAERLAGAGVAVVVGHQAGRVRALLESRLTGDRTASRTAIVEQPEQLGTGHAVLQAKPVFSASPRERPAAFLILNGDTPLLTEATVRELLRVHETDKATVTILTAVLDDATGYGRIVRSNPVGDNRPGLLDCRVLKIVEDRDASPEEKRLREVNVGTYVVDGGFLFEALNTLHPHNAQREYYLTDIVSLAVERGLRVSTVTLSDPDEGLGVNTREQLARAERAMRRQIRERWLDAGVTMRDPATTWIDAGVVIGPDTVLHPNVTLEGSTVIGEDCVIRSNVRLTDCVLGNRVEILEHCVLREARLEDDTTLGPFVHLRPGTVVRRKAKVGNFVEMKNTDLGEGSKANHLSYLGDTTVGKGVNIGAGTITCNYDGVRKYRTVIEDDVFVGSDTQLIAPVTVGRGAVVAAGTTVTQDVPADALAIARVPQVNREGWAARRRALLTGANREASPATRRANSDRDTLHASRTTPGQPPVVKKSMSLLKVKKTGKQARS
ncbi:MAG: bifunctional protein GlmU [Nitrospiraceae bacterium]|nr:MAG: bifunctional protein GlmU [Nitrospiraceae bacterium]